MVLFRWRVEIINKHYRINSAKLGPRTWWRSTTVWSNGWSIHQGNIVPWLMVIMTMGTFKSSEARLDLERGESLVLF